MKTTQIKVNIRTQCLHVLSVIRNFKAVVMYVSFFIIGRYNLSLPSLETSCCGKTWAVGLSDLLRSGYWPASIHFETVYEAGLFRSFLDLKLFAPGLSRQAFLGMLDRRTEYNGRVNIVIQCILLTWCLFFKVIDWLFQQSGKICEDTFQKALLEWTFAQHEVERLCGVQPFKCPACSPSMHAISVDGNRKLYRFNNAHGYVFFFIFLLYYLTVYIMFLFPNKIKHREGLLRWDIYNEGWRCFLLCGICSWKDQACNNP